MSFNDSSYVDASMASPDNYDPQSLQCGETGSKVQDDEGDTAYSAKANGIAEVNIQHITVQLSHKVCNSHVHNHMSVLHVQQHAVCSIDVHCCTHKHTVALFSVLCITLLPVHVGLTVLTLACIVLSLISSSAVLCRIMHN
jgi:hypothetical protein